MNGLPFFKKPIYSGLFKNEFCGYIGKQHIATITKGEISMLLLTKLDMLFINRIRQNGGNILFDFDTR